MPNKVWYLERSRLFGGLPASDIHPLAQAFRERDFDAGATIFMAGDSGDAVYLLKTGFVRLYRLSEEGREVTLAILGPGDVFGELALFDEKERVTNACTMSAAHVCAASVAQFMTLMRGNYLLTYRVAREMARRRDEAETRIAGTTFASARARVATVLLTLAEQHGSRLADGAICICVRFSHLQLASFAGTARETATVELSRMQREGLIRTESDRSLSLLDLERLKPSPLYRAFRLSSEQQAPMRNTGQIG